MYTTDKASCSPVQLTDHTVIYRISTLSFTTLLSERILTLVQFAIKNDFYDRTLVVYRKRWRKDCSFSGQKSIFDDKATSRRWHSEREKYR